MFVYDFLIQSTFNLFYTEYCCNEIPAFWVTACISNSKSAIGTGAQKEVAVFAVKIYKV